MNHNYTDYETQKRIMLEYLQVKVAQEDWHGVADAAMDIREMQAIHSHKESKYEQRTGKGKKKSS